MFVSPATRFVAPARRVVCGNPRAQSTASPVVAPRPIAIPVPPKPVIPQPIISKPAPIPVQPAVSQKADLKFCYDKLQHVSRSFAAVIAQLDSSVRDAVCIFYLVLRGLDTVEDDTSVDLSIKIPELEGFHERLDQPGWNMHGVGINADEQELLEHFDAVIRAYQHLPRTLQEPIQDICKKMGYGMADFQRQNGRIGSVKEYDLYCHYVAGLVGQGLSRLFAASGLESAALGESEHGMYLANEMGLALQKVNITRDFWEDMEQSPPRIFWPQEIWSKHTDDLRLFLENENRPLAVSCLNDMTADALRHLPACLEYLSTLRNASIFRFCAIPQVMAVATLARLYDNPAVFHSVVKIPKTETLRILLNCNNLADVAGQIRKYTEEIRTAVSLAPASITKTQILAHLDEVSCRIRSFL
eukprot:TRINITY_DN1358_c0_g1_i1.p1 TRINITY_DN1358_c0_g1~~TRINITY_DN1358_c0_g1_i1.p1  ORF type:complete len:415 (-),score=57.55 TRINITY_DN1358_c0_g1_i1:70-1314(-)